MKCRLGVILLCLFALKDSSLAADALPEQAASALKRAVEFHHGKVAVHGGYVYRYSDDLAKREGEGKVENEKVWVQPPGTPSVGMAYLEAYELLGEDYLLKAARDAAECLIQGQLRTGGWRESIEFEPAERKKFADRVEKQHVRQSNPRRSTTRMLKPIPGCHRSQTGSSSKRNRVPAEWRSAG